MTIERETQSIEQFTQALLDFVKSQEYNGFGVLLIRDIGPHPQMQKTVTNCPKAADAAALLFDGAHALALKFGGRS